MTVINKSATTISTIWKLVASRATNKPAMNAETTMTKRIAQFIMGAPDWLMTKVRQSRPVVRTN
ncbi:hypothetical protein [Hyphomicrobium sp.]|uniref:hypothetical protein n=1 Tax=Hyphomicrobium sp. TaxID=82 RepID=UPI002D7A2A60|nr:hypothetical protein [Hyphomicrobium sp.]HET6387984.1 hypothetical protein [Hyphomicrobium sp.]